MIESPLQATLNQLKVAGEDWAAGSHIPIPYAEAKLDFEQVEEAFGAVNSETLLAYAASKTAKLHDYFEWDNSVAGHQYREHQARHLIRSVEVWYRKPEGGLTKPVRKYMPISFLPPLKQTPQAETGLAPDAAAPSDATPEQHPDDAAVRRPGTYLPLPSVMEQEDWRRGRDRHVFEVFMSARRRYRDAVEFSEWYTKLYALIDERAQQEAPAK